jgi:site-specific DNA-methyltransferase (adenine-specific)
MVEVADRSVHLVVTSPPYWQLKDYGHEEQIGYHDNLTDYINDLNLVWQECERVLHPGCRLCVNIGDQFARALLYGRYKVISIQSEIIRFCEAIGMDYMGTIIWQKVTTVNTTGGAVIMGSYPYPRNGIVKMDYEYILLFKKTGKPPAPSPEAKERSRLTAEEWNQYFYGHWNFPGVRQDRHLAAFPEELPRRLIRMFTFVGETVLDPFLGSGTTAVAAQQTGRSSIGYEINPTFEPLIRSRLGADHDGLFENPEVIVEHCQPRSPADRSHEQLPLRFTDPHTMQRVVDPKKVRLGSKIDGNESGKPREYTVSAVTDNLRLIMDTGLEVCPAGLDDLGLSRSQLYTHLKRATVGKRVRLDLGMRAPNPDGSVAGQISMGGKALVTVLMDELAASTTASSPTVALSQ